MKFLLFICAALLGLATADLPIGYFTLLRIVVSIGAGAVIIKESRHRLNFWNMAFGLIAILFNPIFPVYLGNKAVWVPIDLICGVLFLIKAFLSENNPNPKATPRTNKKLP
jgi:hypothetical protein